MIDTLLERGCTILVPTFSWSFSIPPPVHPRPPRNGFDYSFELQMKATADVYTPRSNEIDNNMGVLSSALLARPERVRGNHPLNSFAGLGPMAGDLVRDQAPLNVYASLEALADAGGVVLLVGVGLDSMTLLHLAERRAGRTAFRRWAKGLDGRAMMVETGGCSQGFPRLEETVGPLSSERLIGKSRWRAFPAARTLDAAAKAIHTTPSITRCDDPHCQRCRDAILGGPLV